MMAQFRVEDRTISGRHGPIPLRSYIPIAPVRRVAPFVWVHGGGFMSGDLDFAETRAPAEYLAAGGREVITVDYRLVPKFALIGRFTPKPSANRYPVPVDDVVDAVADAARRHPSERLILGGASAGACLAATAAIRIRDTGAEDPPLGLALIYGLFHGILPAPRPEQAARLRVIERLMAKGPDLGRRMNLNYVGTEELLNDPRVFPGTSDVHALPPTLLLHAERDGLRPSGEAFAEHLRTAGVVVDERVLPGSSHGYLSKPASLPYRDGMTVLKDWLNRLG